MQSGSIRIAFLAAGLVAGGCGTGAPRFTSADRADPSYREGTSHQLDGVASYYADEFNGRKTANGETYNMHELTAAHRTLPFGTKVRVTHRETGKSVIVRINDRGPFKDERVIDLSLGAAKELGMIASGTGRVILEILELGIPTK